MWGWCLVSPRGLPDWRGCVGGPCVFGVWSSPLAPHPDIRMCPDGSSNLKCQIGHVARSGRGANKGDVGSEVA